MEIRNNLQCVKERKCKLDSFWCLWKPTKKKEKSRQKKQRQRQKYSQGLSQLSSPKSHFSCKICLINSNTKRKSESQKVPQDNSQLSGPNGSHQRKTTINTKLIFMCLFLLILFVEKNKWLSLNNKTNNKI